MKAARRRGPLLVALAAVGLCAITADGAGPATRPSAAATRAAATLPPPEIRIDVSPVGDARLEYLVYLDAASDDPARPASERLPAFPFPISPLFDGEEARCQRDHTKHTLAVQCTARGLARPARGGKWALTLPQAFNADYLRAGMRVDDDVVVLRADPERAATASGPHVCRVALPRGCARIELLANAGQLAFQMPPAPATAPSAAAATAGEVEFHLDVRPELVGCLAKTYGYPDLGLWLARSRLTNGGNRPITGYRVRYRLDGYVSDWTDCRCATVLPGQTVVDGYFPLLDVEKLARLNGINQAALDAEYEFVRDDGTKAGDKEGRRLVILGHNDLPTDQGHRDLLPMAMASLSTKDDRVIQKVAAMVSGQVPGGIDQSKRPGTLRFMRELYRFMLSNRFAYQIPPADPGVQHVKFGRDVVLDRSGTCIDLAVFYASACEAVGMRTRFVVRFPRRDAEGHLVGGGHCYPVIYVPEEWGAATDDAGRPVKGPDGKPVPQLLHAGEWQAVETTMIADPSSTFADALDAGSKEHGEDFLMSLLADPSVLIVDVLDQRFRGVHSMELPNLDENALKVAGIAAAPPDIVGIWVNRVNNVKFTSEFKRDGTMATVWSDADSGMILYKGVGRYTYDGKLLTYSFPTGSQEAEVSWTDAEHLNYRTLKSSVPGATGVETVMTRVREEKP